MPSRVLRASFPSLLRAMVLNFCLFPPYLGVVKQRELDVEGPEGGRILVLLAHGSATSVDESDEGQRVRFGLLTVVCCLQAGCNQM